MDRLEWVLILTEPRSRWEDRNRTRGDLGGAVRPGAAGVCVQSLWHKGLALWGCGFNLISTNTLTFSLYYLGAVPAVCPTSKDR